MHPLDVAASTDHVAKHAMIDRQVGGSTTVSAPWVRFDPSPAELLPAVVVATLRRGGPPRPIPLPSAGGAPRPGRRLPTVEAWRLEPRPHSGSPHASTQP